MKLFIYSLIGCPWSLKSEDKLKAYIPNIIKVDQSEKSKFKKMNNMETFPQIFLIDDNEKAIKIGGYDATMQLLSDIFENKEIVAYDEKDKQSLIKFFTNKKKK
jgi:glutaredoxin